MSGALRRATVIGDALIDEWQDGGTTAEAVGGAALNVAAGLRTLGVDARLVAMVGDDADGAAVRAHLEEVHVPLVATAAPNGTARATSVRVAGEPTYVFNEAAMRRRVELDGVDLGDDLVVVSCVAFDDMRQARAIAEVPSPEGRLVIDPNPRPGMLNDRDAFRSGFLEAASRALLVKVSDEDAAVLGFDGLDALVAALRDSGTRLVLATEGPRGASLHGEGVGASAPVTVRADAVVDTMGAGDATLATVVAGLAAGEPADAAGWQALLERAMAVAGATCTAYGAQLRLPR